MNNVFVHCDTQDAYNSLCVIQEQGYAGSLHPVPDGTGGYIVAVVPVQPAGLRPAIQAVPGCTILDHPLSHKQLGDKAKHFANHKMTALNTAYEAIEAIYAKTQHPFFHPDA